MALNSLLVPHRRRRFTLGVAATIMLVAIAGCGRRGALEAPPGAAVAPKPAASVQTAAPTAKVISSDFADLDDPELLIDDTPRFEGQTPPPAVAPAPVDPNKPRKRFLLDPLVE